MSGERYTSFSYKYNWAQFSENYEHRVFSATAFLAQRQRIAREVVPGHVVDLGCGPTGWLLSHVSAMRDVFAIGLDSCGEMIVESRKKTATVPVVYLQADLRKLPFSNGSIETAISINSFVPETRPEAEEMFREAARVIRHGGRLIAVLPSFEMSIIARDSWGMQVLIDVKEHREWDTLGWQSFYTVTDIEGLIAKCGFRSARIDRMEFSTGPEIAHILEVYFNSLRGVSIEKLVQFPLFEHFIVAER